MSAGARGVVRAMVGAEGEPGGFVEVEAALAEFGAGDACGNGGGTEREVECVKKGAEGESVEFRTGV